MITSDECHNFGINDGCKIECPVLQAGKCTSYGENREMLEHALLNGEDVIEIMRLYDSDIDIDVVMTYAKLWMNTLDDEYSDDHHQDYTERQISRMVLSDFIKFLSEHFDDDLISINQDISSTSRKIIDLGKEKEAILSKINI